MEVGVCDRQDMRRHFFSFPKRHGIGIGIGD
jgi:hypothetical protein